MSTIPKLRAINSIESLPPKRVGRLRFVYAAEPSTIADGLPRAGVFLSVIAVFSSLFMIQSTLTVLKLGGTPNDRKNLARIYQA